MTTSLYQKVIFLLSSSSRSTFLGNTSSYAPGLSTFIRTERRMEPSSRTLVGFALILPHYYFGSHLNEHRYTVNGRLEKSEFAGKVLSEMWNTLTIYGDHIHD